MTRVEAEDGQPDPTLAALVAEAAEDEDTLGVILTGSRGADLADESSDYDLLWVLTDGAYEQRRAAGGTKIERRFDVGPPAEIVYTSPQVLRETAEEPGWWTPGIASGVLLLDKTGEVAERLQQVARIPEERERADAHE